MKIAIACIWLSAAYVALAVDSPLGALPANPRIQGEAMARTLKSKISKSLRRSLGRSAAAPRRALAHDSTYCKFDEEVGPALVLGGGDSVFHLPPNCFIHCGCAIYLQDNECGPTATMGLHFLDASGNTASPIYPLMQYFTLEEVRHLVTLFVFPLVYSNNSCACVMRVLRALLDV